jgi:anti-anti-sigma factor
MLDITLGTDGTVVLAGRFDAAQAGRAQTFLDGVERPRVIDCAGLDYVSSAGLGVLLHTHKRALASGGGLELVNVNKHIVDILRYSALDRVFRIEPATGP